MKHRIRIFIPLLCLIFSLGQVALAHAHRLDREEDYSLDYYRKQTLFGDWDGVRSSLHKRGFDLELEFFGDFLGNVVGGGPKKGHAVGYVEAEILINAERWIGWTGAQFFFMGYGLANTDPLFNSIRARRLAILKRQTQ